MNAEDSSKSSCELGHSIILKESCEGPFHANGEHDCVTGVHEEGAFRLNPELENVPNAQISVLTTLHTGRDGPSLDAVVPSGRIDLNLILVVEPVCAGIRVVNPDECTLLRCVTVRVQGEPLLLRRRSCVLYRVVLSQVHEAWESLLADLASVGAIPAFIHVSVQAIAEVGIVWVVINVYRLRRSVHTICVL